MELNKLIKKTIRQYLNEEHAKNKLHNLKKELALAAQKVYDDWEQDEDGYCDWLGAGGICQDIAEQMAHVLNEHGIDCAPVSQTVGEQHVYVVAKTEDGVFIVDIPPYLYETGGGYCWKKIKDVIFDESYIVISMLSPDPDEFENYIEEL